MGSSNSKVNSAGEVVPAKIGPFLLRQYEELKKRRQKPATTILRESTLSMKKLLKEDEDAGSNSSLETEAVYKAVVASSRKPEPAKVVPLPDTECKNIENRMGNTEQRNQEKGKDGKDKETRAVVGKTENEHEGVDEKNNDEDEDDDDDDDEVDKERNICPSSPSFKIYCIPEQDHKEESVDGPSSRHLKSPSVDSIQSAASSESPKSLNESVEMESSTKRKGNKKKKFRAVRNLIKVKSFYPSCTCAGNGETRPLRAKAAN